jgi:hypothetical protein
MNYRYQGGTKGQRHKGTKFFSFPSVPALSVAYTTANRYNIMPTLQTSAWISPVVVDKASAAAGFELSQADKPCGGGHEKLSPVAIGIPCLPYGAWRQLKSTLIKRGGYVPLAGGP